MRKLMINRRVEQRLLCADLVKLEWREPNGVLRRLDANLEDISLKGACLQIDSVIPVGITVQIRHANGSLAGIVRYCVYRDIGYFIGIEFEPGSKWSPRSFRPMHLLDPRTLLRRTIDRVTGRPAA